MRPNGLFTVVGQSLAMTVVWLAVALIAPSVLFGAEGTAKRPNILFCFADDWGWPHAGAYGDPVVQTPAFDRIAREGVLFEHAYISSPSCTPSRNAIVTGQQFYRLGHGANLWSTLDVKQPNFMFMLRAAGYEIGHWRKAWGPGKYQVGGYKEHPCGPDSNFTKFMTKRDKSKPFCFWFGTSDPHRGYKLGSGKQSSMDITKVPVPEFWPNVEVIQSDIADYYYEVQRWDRDVAAAMKLVEDAGELENTLIVMSGDHGMPFPRCKGNLYDWGSRVPMAVRWGAKIAKPGRRVTDFVSTTDLAPTFLAAAGIDVPKVMTGRSLVPIFESRKDGRVVAGRDHVIYGRERHTPAQEAPEQGGYPARALRTDKYLYIVNHLPDRWPAGTPHWKNAFKSQGWLGDCDGGPTKNYLVANRGFDSDHGRFYDLNFAKRPAEELFVIADDRDNVRNVAADPAFADVKAKLAKQLHAALLATGDPRATDPKSPLDHHPYYGGIPKWPGEAAIEKYKR